MKQFVNIFLVASSILLSLILAEVGLATLDATGLFPRYFESLNRFGTSFDLENGTGLYFSHPYSSYEIRPGYQQSGKAHINNLGFRGDEVKQKKPPGVFRIVALGDSTTYGIYNRYDETYPYLLQAALRQKFNTDKIEVVNAGLVSATSAEHLVRFFLKVLPLEPDMLLLYGSLGDVFPRVFNKYRSDYYHFRRTPTPNAGFLSNTYLGRLLSASILSRVMPNTRLRSLNLLEYTWRMENMPPETDQRIRNFYKTGNSVFKRNIEYMVQAARANSVEVVLITFPFNKDKPNWQPAVPNEVWEPGIAQNNQALTELAHKYDLSICRFAEVAATDPTIFEDSIHLNARGNDRLANCVKDVIANTIVRALAGAGGD